MFVDELASRNEACVSMVAKQHDPGQPGRADATSSSRKPAERLGLPAAAIAWKYGLHLYRQLSGAAGIVKAFLMYPDRDFDLDRDLPPNEAELSSDLELDILLAGHGRRRQVPVPRGQAGHSFAPQPTRLRLSTGSACWPTASLSPAWSVTCTTSRWRRSPEKRRSSAWLFRDSPETIVHRTRQLLQLYADMFRRLRDIADTHAADNLGSEGFTRFFAMLSKELGDEYLAEIEARIGELAFRRGTLISARLGEGLQGRGLRAGGGNRSRAGAIPDPGP